MDVAFSAVALARRYKRSCVRENVSVKGLPVSEEEEEEEEEEEFILQTCIQNFH